MQWNWCTYSSCLIWYGSARRRRTIPVYQPRWRGARSRDMAVSCTRLAGKETRETAAAPRKSMGKLGAKLAVREQSRIGAADSIDAFIQLRRRSTTWTAFYSIAFVSWPGCFSFPRTLLKLPATFPERRKGSYPGRPTFLPCSTFHCHGEFRSSRAVGQHRGQKKRAKASSEHQQI
jgi:hypothetical protein